ncbi:DUF202 domain-containing protein [Micromonospora sp. WMMD1128]|uniref:DUF202 domain-containing protein n=1 Tax=unclassified Micromonospora TaxID=2617518 RepID=UPI00248B54C9|nr:MULTISPECIES: DUF202 domain-containing protein [unclassified Micromonospora]WBB76028.1 DUF202 domain-containing protein [Micromonospora sp. WMMD1128]WFE36188.1 DUF202 domain-containing protein [Micromonospora sp. WMMD975]
MSSGPAANAPTDRGLQVERTVLAWRRTAAAFVVAAAVAGRLLLPHRGGWLFLAAVTGATAIVVAAAVALRRRHPVTDLPAAPDAARTPARWLAAVTVATLVGGLGVALAVLVGSP